MEDYAIKISDLSKKYRIGQLKSTSLRESLFNFSKNKEEDFFWALKDINLIIKRGEAVGIIGKNGAGKSTLLKILSKITYPTNGKVEINGRVSSLLEVGTGFHPELSGRENVFLNGTILGMRRNEIKSKFDEIVDFSGVGNFIDTPIKHYSSGMKVRLAFAVAAFLEPEILIIDEVLAVGDADFQKKCLGKMEEVTGEGRTVLFVSHNMDAVSKLCNNLVYLKDGKVTAISKNVNQVITNYLNQDQDGNDNDNLEIKNVGIKNEIHSIDRVAIINERSEIHKKNIHFQQQISVLIQGFIFKNDQAFNLGINIYNQKNDTICWSWIKTGISLDESKLIKEGSFSFLCQIPQSIFNNGNYRIEIVSVLHNVKSLIKKGEGPSISYNIIGGDKGVLLNLPLSWSSI